MTAPDPTTLLQPASTQVRDPLSGRSVWLASMVRNVRTKGDDLIYDLHFESAHTVEHRQQIPAQIEANLRELGFTDKVYVMHAGAPPGAGQPARPAPKKEPVRGMTGPGMQPHGGPIQKQKLPGVKHLIAVASGKGGVGKSTIATNLAVGLAKLGYSVGLMDADIYGPSLPTMMATTQRPMVDPEERKILPVPAHGVKCLSMGLLVDPEEAMIWRGPMVMGAVRQFLQDCKWGETDYLVIDLPPGTGDAQLTLVQAVELAGAVIVTTPQAVALADAIRGITMFRKLDVPLLGLVENMAWYSLPDGTRDHVFGEGGGRRTAVAYDTELLAQVPLKSSLRASGDEGQPAVLGTDPVAETFMALARRIAEKVPVEVPA